MKNHDKKLWTGIQKSLNTMGFDAGTPDGTPGPMTGGAMERALQRLRGFFANVGDQEKDPKEDPAPDPPKENPKDDDPSPVDLSKLDDRSKKNIESLHPKVQSVFTEIALKGKEIAKELGADDYRMISGHRTYAEQNALYAKGRTKSGSKVTNARGGYSNHNFGIAGDFGVFGKDGSYLDSSNPSLAAKVHKAVADWAKKNHKIEWGGDWRSFKDYPHFQYDNGKSLSEMRSLVDQGKSVV